MEDMAQWSTDHCRKQSRKQGTKNVRRKVVRTAVESASERRITYSQNRRRKNSHEKLVMILCYILLLFSVIVNFVRVAVAVCQLISFKHFSD